MTTFARVMDGVVREVFRGDELFPMHPDLAADWRQASDGTAEGWTFDGTRFAAPAAPSAGERAERRVAAIKADARRRILDRYPDWRQANMTARGVELQDLWRRHGEWTDAEAAEAAALQAAWDWIKTVRRHSDALEADAGADLAAGWPD